MNNPAAYTGTQSTDDAAPFERGAPIGHRAAGDWPCPAPRSSSALLLAGFFLLMRPEQKKRKEMEDLIANLKKNDRVETIGGIVATVVSVVSIPMLFLVIQGISERFSGASAREEKAPPIATDSA